MSNALVRDHRQHQTDKQKFSHTEKPAWTVTSKVALISPTWVIWKLFCWTKLAIWTPSKVSRKYVNWKSCRKIHVGEIEFFSARLKVDSQDKSVRYMWNKMIASTSEKLIKPWKIFFKKVYAIQWRFEKVFYMSKLAQYFLQREIFLNSKLFFTICNCNI